MQDHDTTRAVFHGTTIVCVRRPDPSDPSRQQVAMGGDGQVTLGHIVVKASARKVRRLYRDQVLAGFAGATADAFTLFERFEAKLDKHQGHLVRAAVELTLMIAPRRAIRGATSSNDCGLTAISTRSAPWMSSSVSGVTPWWAASSRPTDGWRRTPSTRSSLRAASTPARGAPAPPTPPSAATIA